MDAIRPIFFSNSSNFVFSGTSTSNISQAEFAYTPDYMKVVDSIRGIWQSTNGTSNGEGLASCLRDAFSRSWWATPFYAYSCKEYVGDALTNVVVGTKDVAQIVIGFTTLFFFWYMTRVPEKDAWYTISLNLNPPLRILEEIPELLVQLSTFQVADRMESSDHYVEIKPKSGDSFYVTKVIYNMLAKENGCQLK